MAGATTSGDEPTRDDQFPPPELEDYGKARYEAVEGPRAVVREARRICGRQPREASLRSSSMRWKSSRVGWRPEATIAPICSNTRSKPPGV
jgi:hypothetical protein